MFEIWECVIMDDDIQPLILIDKTNDIEMVKTVINTNQNYIVWDNQNQCKVTV